MRCWSRTLWRVEHSMSHTWAHFLGEGRTLSLTIVQDDRATSRNGINLASYETASVH